ncbi:hydroxymethylbilane synthase [Desulfovibrio sp. OttesenSCG-928-F07]|nr:hydroxymethylbilane synthase [Desulfovibrio sp. OttesenSCG-928-F07]
MTKITIATRGSRLALWQAEHIKNLLINEHPGLEVDLLVLKTKGDIILDVPLAKVGGKGLFVKEIEEALLDGRADLAVHSMKDVPMELPETLTLGVIPLREDPCDSLLSVNFDGIGDLPQGAVIGTSSLRRQAQIMALRPDLKVVSLRGNVDTRLRKLNEGQFDAIIMAAAGIKRLNLAVPKEKRLPVKEFVPACGQGALGIEYSEKRTDIAAMLGFLNHPETRCCVEAERAFLAALEGGCQTPIAGHAVMSGPDTLILDGLVADLTGSRIIRKQLCGKCTDAKQIGQELAESIKNAGAKEILDEIYKSGSVE